MTRFRFPRLGRRETPEVDTDARPAERRADRSAEAAEAQRRTAFYQRVVVIALATIFVAGAVAALVGEGGYHDLQALRTEAGDLQTSVAGLQLDVNLLEAAIRELEQDPAARERIAREELGFVAPGEVDLLLPRHPGGDEVPSAPKKRGARAP